MVVRALELLEEWAPDVLVCGGDLLEAEAASRFVKENPNFLELEYREASRFLSKVRAATGRADLILLDGNHDDNLKRPGRLPVALRGLCQPERDLELGAELKNWKRVPYINGPKGCFWLGKVCFKHGFSTTGEDLEALQFAGDTPSALVVGGHTHRTKEVTRCMRTRHVPLHTWYCNGGTLGPTHPEWAHRENCREWGAAVVLGACQAGRASDRWVSGVNWTAEVIRIE